MSREEEKFLTFMPRTNHLEMMLTLIKWQGQRQDLQEQKITLPLLGALQAAPEQEASVRRMVTQIGEHPEYQMEIVAFVKARGGMDYAVARLDEYVDKAIAALDVLPQGEDRQALADLARFVSERKS